MKNLKEQILTELDHPKIEQRIEAIIENPQPVLRDMILFAEYLERKHGRGFVVYWCKAGTDRFEVCNWDEWQTEQDKDWNGDAQWHTNLCPVNYEEEEVLT
jgi:hypothetical protein